MTPTDQQIAALEARLARLEVLVRQLQGRVALRVVGALPALGDTGDMVLFGGNVWIDNGTAWKQLVYA